MLEVTLILAAFLVSLVAGLLLVFSMIVMPGLGTLDNLGFLRAFKAIDRIIQDSQPIFVLVWGGSIVAVVAAAVLAVTQANGLIRVYVLAAAGVYLLGVQVLTFVNNIPLNNQLQAADLDAMSEQELAAARANFEPNWNRWNLLRTVFACLASVLFLVALTHL